jgi:hypothetical protein
VKFGLPEEVVLLGLDDETGRCISSYSGFSWTAAVLAELRLLGCIDVSGPRIVVVNDSLSDDEILDEALATLQDRNLRLASAVRAHLVNRGRERTLARLVEAGILEYHDNRVLGIFHVRRYPAHDGKVEAEIRQRLRDCILEAVEPDARTQALIGIAAGSGLLRAFLSRDERHAARNRINSLTTADPICQAVRKIIQEEEAAVTTAAIIAATS